MPKKGELVKAVANWLNRLGYQLTRYAFPVKVQLRDAKNILSFPIAFCGPRILAHAFST